jgi:pheromone shutdown-related protein TraB
MDFPSCVTRWEQDGRDVTIIGTAHVSQASVEEVRRVIAQVAPDTVCVELDKNRRDALLDQNRYSRLNLVQKIRERQIPFLLASLVLAAYQKRIGQRLGVTPGAELLAAIRACDDIGAKLVLADRDIQTTLKRTWANISVANKLRLLFSLVAAPLAAADLSQDQIEQLKNRDTISEMLAEVSRMVPGLKEPLIDERDQYLASSVTTAPGKKIVVVVGAGHVAGVLENLGKPVDRSRLEQLPRSSAAKRYRRWLMPAIVLACLIAGWRLHGIETLVHQLTVWAFSTGIGCALLTATAGAHPLTVVGASLAAPFLTLYPQLGVASVAGLIQTSVRRPTTEHCATILESVATLRGWYRNPATRVLLVYLLSALGAALGALIGTVWVIALL